MVARPRILSESQRGTLDAAARRIVPHAFDGQPTVDLTARVEERLASAPTHIIREFRLALTVLGSRAAALAFAGVPTPFVNLSDDTQARLLSRLGASSLGVPKTIYQGVRRLVLAVWYSLPESHDDIGYLGPFHLRGPVFDWEGALRDSGRETRGAESGEPVARETVTTAPAPRRYLLGAAARYPQPATRSYDAIVIGSGAGGAVAAARLAEAGREVLIVEEGSLVEGEELDEREGEMMSRLYADGGLRATDDLSFALLQGATVGGGTHVNWMITLRAPEFVLDEWRSRYGITGYSAADLTPVYDRVEQEIHATTVPTDAHSRNNRLLLHGARSLGWKVFEGKVNARGCIRAGACGLGCRYGAKQSVVSTYLPRALGAGARLLPDARVDRIEIAERDGAGAGALRGTRQSTAPRKRLHITLLDSATRTPNGTQVAEAPVVILAAGAVGSPVVLQRSGLGSDAVGQYLRLHPTTAVAALHDEDVYAAAGIPQSVVCDEFLNRDGRGYGFWLECAPHYPALGAVAAAGFGAAHREDMREFRRTSNFISLVRDGADFDVSNGSVRLDRSGRTCIRYRLGNRDRGHVVEGIEAAARLQLAAGAREVRTLHTAPCRIRTERDLAQVRTARFGPNDLTMFSAHVNGTCRMGTDPRRSVATPEGERHGVRGLYICDGSLFPTAPGVNPQATIMAIATLIADRMVCEGRV